MLKPHEGSLQGRHLFERGPFSEPEAPVAQKNLLQRFVDDGDVMLGCALETKEGREIYADVRRAVEEDDVLFVYDTAHNQLVDYTEKHSLASDDAKIIAWAMIEKALTECIQKELSE